MKRSTITIAAGLLFTAAALKLAFPAESTQVINTVKDTSSTNETILQDIPYLSEGMSSVPVTVTINAEDFLNGTETAAETTELPEAVEEAVETFLASQAPYDSMDLPADVTYDVVLPTFNYVRPVEAAASSGFGYRVHPLENLTKFHYGTDLAALSGDDIVSFAAGTVTEVGEDETYGKFIRISHDDGYASMYAHCGTVYVTEGQKVAVGEKIGLVGTTGKVTGPNLHFELTKDGVFVNPEFYLAAL